jgi:uncharacterized protein (TIGR00255 family)
MRGLAVDVEVRSVNHRFLQVKARLPAPWAGFEPEVEEIVRRRLERGSVYVTVGARQTAPERDVRLNLPLARRYAALLRTLGRSLRLDGGLEIEDLAALPGVLGASEPDLRESEREFAAVRRALASALDRLVSMRDREGKTLARDLDRRASGIEGRVGKIERRAPAVVAGYREKLGRRMKDLLEGTEARVREEDLAREVAVFADRCDVSEEITRLRSHLREFRRTLRGSGSVGRTLDFLIQEMLRETNTIGSKASDAAIASEVVALKSEIEKVREQVQNVE